MKLVYLFSILSLLSINSFADGNSRDWDSKTLYNSCYQAGKKSFRAGYFCYKTAAINLKASFTEECRQAGIKNVRAGYYCYKNAFKNYSRDSQMGTYSAVSDSCRKAAMSSLEAGYYCYKSAAYRTKAQFAEWCHEAGKRSLRAGYACYNSGFNGN